MAASLSGKKVALLVTDGFEQTELTDPKQALEGAEATAEIVSPRPDKVRGWKFDRWGEEFPVDVKLEQAKPEDYDALVLPGGVMNSDSLRTDEAAVRFIRAFVEQDKPVAAICHGPWTLIEADAVRGRQMTSYGSIKTDLKNAGAEWVDQEVVIDGHLVTSRKPDDLPAFNRTILDVFAGAT